MEQRNLLSSFYTLYEISIERGNKITHDANLFSLTPLQI